MIFETSWDDSCRQNMRLAKLLKKYNVDATFFIEANQTKHAKKLLKMGFDIGSHTFIHPSDLKLLSSEAKRTEIVKSKKHMENLLGIEVLDFCYPRGRYDDECVELVKEAGYESARTTEVLKTSYEDKYKKPTTIHFYPRKEYDGWPVLAIAKDYLNKAKKEDSYFHLWGHGWEIEKYDLWSDLEEFLKYATN